MKLASDHNENSTRRGTRTSDYDFELPADRIAQRPFERRDASRLMVVHRASGTIEHHAFTDLAALIDPRDVLVVNRTRVIRARLLGIRASGAPAEVLLLKSLGDGRYEAMFCYKMKNYALYDGKKVTLRGSALRSRGIEPYLKKLSAQEKEIDGLTTKQKALMGDEFTARKKYEGFLANITDEK